MPMTVEDLSRRTGVSANTIRYYTRIGLLEPNRHPENGYRLFREADVRRLEFVGKAKVLGLSLSEILELIRTAERGGSPCSLARALVARRAEEVRHQIAALQELHADMSAAMSLWETIPDGPRDGRSICPLIESVVPAIPAARRRRAGFDLPAEAAM